MKQQGCLAALHRFLDSLLFYFKRHKTLVRQDLELAGRSGDISEQKYVISTGKELFCQGQK